MNEQEIDIRQLLVAFRRHLYFFIAVVIVVVTFTIVYLNRLPKIYDATATIELDVKSSDVLGKQIDFMQNQGTTNSRLAELYYNTQYEIIQSRAVAQKVLEMIPGDNVLEYLGVDLTEIPPEKVVDIDPIAIFLKRLSVNSKKETSLIEITVEDRDPEKAQFFANAVAEAYIEFNLEKKYVETKDAARWLTDQSISLKKSLEDSEVSLFEFKQDNNVLATTFEAKQQLLTTKIVKLTDILTTQEIAKNALDAKIEEYSKLNLDNPEDAFLKEISNDNKMVDALKNKYFEINSQIREMEQFYGEKHPKYMALVAERDSLKEALRKEVELVIRSYNLELSTLESEIKKNRSMLSTAQKDALELNKLDINYSKLLREVETNKKLYDIVLERSKQADLSSLLKNNNVRLIDKALKAKNPVKPNRPRFIAAGFAIAIILGFGSIFVIEFFDTKFRSFSELEKASELPILAVVPKFKPPEDAKFPEISFEEKSKQSLATEAFRTLRTNIKLGNYDKNIKTMLVSSCLPHEGKTTVSSNIGVGYSIAGKRVLLIDADLRKPRLHKVFGLEHEVGLSTLIIGDCTVDQAINKNVYEGIDVITAGEIPPNPAELLESSRFADIIKQLSSMYDIVILDTPPVVPVSDAATIASLVDGVVLVVNIAKTPKDILRSAIAGLKKPTIHLLGIAVNNFDVRQEKGYNSYYGYSYSRSSYRTHYYYYYSEENGERVKKKKHK